MDKLTLEIKGLTKKYKGTTALNNFSVTLHEGIYGLLGPNGAGKSTLMRCIADIIRPTTGEILCNGENVYTAGKAFRKRFGFMPQEFDFYPGFTAVQIMQYFAGLKEIRLTTDELDKRLKDVNLYDDRKKRVGGFSGGMKRRLGIAVTLLNDPEVMVLDEPTAGLDPEERLRFKKNLLKMSDSRIIILATHIISDLESLCNTIFFIKEGELVKTVCDLHVEKQTQKSTIESEYLTIFGTNEDSLL